MNTPEKYVHIKGWGADLNPINRPGYPKERTPPRLEPLDWTTPEQQLQRVEILRSNERPDMTAVFGTGQPPSGVSGWIRRFAFRFSENDLRHWLLLLFADRVNVGEGVAQDISRGHLPRIYSEMGGRAELMHNPSGAAKKTLVLIAGASVAYALLRRRPGKR